MVVDNIRGSFLAIRYSKLKVKLMTRVFHATRVVFEAHADPALAFYNVNTITYY